MSHSGDDRVAHRYARALFTAASQLGKSDRVQSDLEVLAGLWRDTPTLRKALESPLIPAERKLQVLDRAFGKDVDALTSSFLRLLVEKRREGILPAVSVGYRALADQARGMVRAQAVVASDLEAEQQQELVAGLQQRTGKQIELTVRVDPQILGGIVVRLGDTVIDGSVRGALERLRERMLLER